jgi:hypothetical protein
VEGGPCAQITSLAGASHPGMIPSLPTQKKLSKRKKMREPGLKVAAANRQSSSCEPNL